MCSGFVRFGRLEACGRSSLTACVSSGAVMMKMTRSTSITSMSGIMLISASGAGATPCRKPPNAMSAGSLGGRLERHDSSGIDYRRASCEHAVEIVRVSVQAGESQAVRTPESVVSEDGGNRHGQAEGGHDQRFPNRAGDLVERSLAGQADTSERVIHGPHGAEEADKRGRRADRGEHGQAGLDAGGVLVDHPSHGARQKLVVALAPGGNRVPGEVRKRLVG